MQNREQPMPDGTVRVRLSNTFNLAVIGSLLGFGGSVIWFIATQTSILQQIDARQRQFEATISRRADELEKRENERADAAAKRDESRRADTDAAAQRLARIEAQLGFLVAVGARK